MGWKYVPSTIGIVDRKTGRGFVKDAPVLRVVAHPPGTHMSPILSDATALEIITPYGSRWYGCVEAQITSRLRMAFKQWPGTERDEVVAQWDDASSDVVER